MGAVSVTSIAGRSHLLEIESNPTARDIVGVLGPHALGKDDFPP